MNIKKLLLIIVLIIISIDLFSQAATIIGWRNADRIYCVGEMSDTLEGDSPPGKSFYFNGESYTTAAALTRLSNGVAIFYPSIAGLGTDTITYGTIGSHDVTMIVTITSLPAVSLSPFSNVCENAASFSLFNADSSNVSPKTGTFSGPGVDANNNFDPVVAGVGTHTISYTIGVGGCSSSASQTITVLAKPTLVWNPFPNVCALDAAFVLTECNPAGGTYSGVGVDAFGNFDPAVSGIGTFLITYDFSNGSCSNISTQNITVNANPAAGFAGLAAQYCDVDPIANLTGTPTDANGSFSGSGITDNGNGTAGFDPTSSGLGLHQIIYTYIDGNGCMDADTQNVQVGTYVEINNLDPKYCEDETNINISGNPLNGTFNILGGLTDNLDGTAVWDPSVAGPGNFTITYTYVDIWGCINVTSENSAVNILPTPAIIGLNAAYCEDAAIDLITGSYAPFGTFSGSGISDNTNGTGDFDPTSLAVGGPYNVTYDYTNPITGCQASVTNQVNINELPTGIISGDTTICKGEPTPIRIALTGTTPYDFTYSNGIFTYNETNYGLNNYSSDLTPNDTCTYNMVSITDGNGCSFGGSGSALVNVKPNGAFITQPVTQTVCPGDNINYTVTTSGVNVNYQWQKNGIDIAGANNSAFAINNANVADVANYKCVINSECGPAVNSNNAGLSLWTLTSIDSDPVDAHECYGDNINFSITSSGSNLTYQWKKDNDPLLDTGNFLGTSTSDFFISNLTPDDNGMYTCTVSGSCGTYTSNPADLIVDTAINIISNPQNVAGCPGNTVSFNVDANGTDLLYKWQKGGVDIAGETNPILVLNNINVGDAGAYRCVVSSACGDSLYSDVADLTIGTQTVITSNPVDVTGCEGDIASFKVTSTGSSLTYQWKKDGVNISNGGDIFGATSNTVVINNIDITDSASYTCTVSGVCGIQISAPAALIVDTGITIISHPTSKNACLSDNTSFNSIVTGTNLSYQWQKAGVNIPGENSFSHIINSVTALDASTYRCIIKNTCGDSVITNSATLVIDNPTVISTEPQSVTTCANKNVNYSIIATGTNLSYQWKLNGVNLADAGNISGSLSPFLSLSSVTVADVGVYNCRVSGSCNTLNSNTASLSVNDPISITTQPVASTVCVGDNNVMSVTTSGTVLSYQWQLDAVDIPAANAITYSIDSATANAAGVYRCIVNGGCDTVPSDGAFLTIDSVITITTQPSSKNICENKKANFTIAATGSNLSYQWKLNGVNLVNGGRTSNVTTPNLTIDSCKLTDAGSITCQVAGSCATINSNSASLSIKEAINITSQPVSKFICEGFNTSFSVVSSGTNLTYQWQKDGADIVGANSSNYFIDTVVIADAGSYSCVINGDCDPVNSEAAILTVNPYAAITAQPSDKTGCVGNSISFNITASGTGLSYLWKLNNVALADGPRINGSTTNTLIIDTLKTTDIGIYECTVTGVCGTATSNPAVLNIPDSISISAGPTNQTVCQGNNVNFNVVATGTNLTYQWQKDGGDIAGETNQDLTLINVDGTDQAVYRCVLSGTCGTKNTSAANLEIDSSIIITTQPVLNNTLCIGNSVTINVAASGSDIVYQWRKDGIDLADAGSINGTSSPGLTISPVDTSHSGVYSCEIENTCVTLISDASVVTISEPLNLTSHPNNKTICLNENTSFSVSATGTNLTYQWQLDGVNIAGKTNAVLIIDTAQLADVGIYRCVVKSDCDSSYSNPASLTINSDVSITSQPTATQYACENNSISLNLTASGTGITYQWKKSGVDVVDNANISGSQTSTLTIDNLSSSEVGVYTCKITGTCNYENSNIAYLGMYEETVITDHPVDYTSSVGGNADFTVISDGDTLTYLWYKDGVALADGGVVSGSTTSTLDLTSIALVDAGTYHVVVSGICGNAVSDPATLTVLTSSIITTQPVSKNKCVGQSANFSVIATGMGHTYQWKKDGVNLVDNANVSGSTTASLSLSSVSLADAGAYTCRIDNTENSSPAILRIFKSTLISTQPKDIYRCLDDNASFSVISDGDSLLYQWQKDGVDLVDGGNISGVNTELLIISNVAISDAATYRCIVSGYCGVDNSDPGTLSLFDNTQINIQPSGDTVCEDASVTLNVSVGGDSLNYQWKKNGVNISDGGNINGSNSSSLIISNITDSDEGVYICNVDGQCGSKSSGLAPILVYPTATIISQHSDATRCVDDNITFSVSVLGDSLKYQWEKDGVDLVDGGNVSGCNTSVLTISSLISSDAGGYRVKITDNCDTTSTDISILSLTDKTSIIFQPVGDTICETESINLYVFATGDSLQYQWKKNGVDISDNVRITGTATGSLSISSATSTDEGVYSCEITGGCSSVISSLARLVVNPSTNISWGPSDDNGCNGEDKFLIVSATGENLTYQWQQDNVDLVDGGNISGSTTDILSLTSLIGTNEGSYTCNVTGLCGVATSDPATLIVDDLTSITLQPVSDTICDGNTVNLSVVSLGDGLLYQWKRNGNSIADIGDYSGTKTANLSINNTTSAYSGVYTCLVTGNCGSENSNFANVVIQADTKILIHPTDLNKCENDVATFSTSGSGENISYQWQKDGVALADGGTISGSSTNVLNISNVVVGDIGIYGCIVTGDCGTEFSDPATLNVNNPTLISSQPQSDTICSGNSITFTVIATGDNLSYQWQKDGSDISDGGTVTGSATANLILNNTSNSNSGIYTCNISGDCGSITSSPATLLIQEVTTITTQPSNFDKCTGDIAVFSIAAAGESLTYQWEKDAVALVDGANVNGSAATLLSVNNLSIADAGGYRCVITGTCGTMPSVAGNLSVSGYPSAADTIVGLDTVCRGDQGIIYYIDVIADADNYVWTIPPGMTITNGDSTRQIEVKFETNELGGNLSVHGENICGAGTESNILQITANPIPNAYAGENLGICDDEKYLNAASLDSISTGTWSVISGTAFVDSLNNENTRVYNLRQGINTFRWTVIRESCSTYDDVTITNNTLTVDAGNDTTFCSNTYSFNAVYPSAGYGEWSVLQGSGINIVKDDPFSDVSGLANGINVFKWSAIYNGCISYDSVIITNNLPSTPEAGPNQNIKTTNTFLNATTPLVGTGEWSLLTGAGTIADVSLNNSSVTGLSIGNNIFKWTVINENCLLSDTVVIENSTTDTTDAGQNQIICSNTTTLDAKDPYPGTGEWSVVKGSATFSNNTLYNTNVSNLAKGENILLWSANMNGITYDSVIITNNSPTDANAGTDQILCADSAILNANQPLIGTSQWSVIAGAAVFDSSIYYTTKVTGLAPGVNEFKWTIINGICTSTSSVKVTNDTPSDAYAGADITTCADTAVLQPNTPTVGTQEWGILSGSANFVGNVAINIASDTNIIKYSIRQGNCTSSDTIIVVSNKPSNAYSGGDQLLCKDSTQLQASSISIGTGIWDILSGTGNIATNDDPSSLISGLGTGENKFRWTVTYNNCSSFDDVTIRNDYKEADAGSDQTLCTATTSLTGNDPGESDGVWSFIGGGGIISDNSIPNASISNLSKGINILRWTITKNICSSYDEVSITNNLPTTAFAGEDQYLCVDNTTLNANTIMQGTGSWSVLSGLATLADSTLQNTAVTSLGLGANLLRWTSVYLGCQTTDEVIIYNNQPINVSAGLDQILCVDSTVLYANEPSIGNGSWTILQGSGTFSDESLYNSKITNIGNGDNILRWTVSTTNCSFSDTMTITNNKPTDAVAGSDQTVCNSSVDLSANTAINGTGQWTLISGSGTIADNSLSTTSVSGLGLGSNTLRWTIQNVNCTSYDDIIVTNNSPTIADAGIDIVVCGDSTRLYALDPLNGYGYWRVVSGEGIFNDSLSFNTEVNEIGFGNNTYRWITINNNCITYDDVLITNNLANANAGIDKVVYESYTSLIANNPPSGNGLWNLIAGSGNINNPSSYETYISNLGSGKNTLEWTITNNGCTATDEVVITYKPLPIVDFTPDEVEGCPGLSVNFVNNTMNGDTFLWDMGDGNIYDDMNVNHTFNTTGRFRVQLTAYGPDGINVTMDTLIVIHQLPVADFEIAPDTVYINNQAVRCYNYTENALTYNWDFGDGGTSTEFSPSHSYSEAGTFTITLNVMSGENCTDSASLSVVSVENGSIILPNAFTPSLDGPSGGAYSENDRSNDVFRPHLEGVEEYKMEIYSRWGILLFESDNIEVGWDGYYKGKLLNKDVYVWKITGVYESGTPFSMAGTVLLLR